MTLEDVINAMEWIPLQRYCEITGHTLLVDGGWTNERTVLKDFRAVATRYDKRGHNFLAGVHVACILLWLL